MSTNADTASSSPVTPNDLPQSQSDHHQAQLDKRRTTLLASISKLKTQISETESQLREVNSKLRQVKKLSLHITILILLLCARSPENASQTVRNHIHLLHAYNEIRGIGQGLLGLVADARGARHVDIQNEFGISPGD
ncbi:hypothetical protein PISL3812_05619 [Talaromyces islandicus]|uniref:DNA repair protein Swi5/Sae3 n=1 Tax=Talaromyces islandicus TaxID=28573 RepID=A0A0U1LZ34_TALIS|nr:hypothetical protein PISL3812_05619 [Talaromyces islandicus]